MKTVVWVDDEGLKHRSIVRDGDTSEQGVNGLPHDPPDLGRLDWTEIEKEMHNALVSQGLSTLDDVVAAQTKVSSIIVGVIKPRVIGLFKQANEDAH